MNFDDPEMVESLAYDLKLGDWPRSQNRARINDEANGKPPYSPEEVRDNGIAINVSDLELTRSLQHARSQFYSAFLKPAHFFQAKIDSGPKHKRQEWNTIATSKAARVMKRSLPYFESMRSRFASDVLHGIGPSGYEDRDKWCPDPLGIEDVLIPSDTLLTMKNLPFFFIYKSWTAPELIKLTTGPRVDPGWNLELIQSCLEWLDSQMMQLRNNNWPEAWSPEKAAERIKSDGGWYAGDQAPRIDCYDFYFWSDEGRNSGWRRRVILDPWSTPEASGGGYSMSRRRDDMFSSKSGFLFNPGKRRYASRLSELINFQFADLSAVAPFRYHSVRSLGYLLFAVCHMQNRMHCRLSEHVFESMMQYFTGASEDDYQRALKVELINRAFIDKTIKMMPPNERWQIDPRLVQFGMAENRQIIQDSSSSWSQNQDYSSDRTEKTKFQVMAEVSASTSMISAALLQAYAYQEFEYKEIFRRLCRKNSRDPDCREFRADCLRQGIPDEYLHAECWDIEAERVMGAGNKTMELAIAEQLWNMRQAYDPAAQREILRDITLLITDDSVRTRAYVPDGPRPVSDSQHDAELSLAPILMGKVVLPVDGQNHKEVIAIWLADFSRSIQAIEQRGGMAEPQELMGLQNLSMHIKRQIEIVARDESEIQLVKIWRDQVGKLDNYLKGYEQRLMEAQQQAAEAQNNGNGGIDPETAAKIQGTIITAQAKAQNTRESHALKMAQRRMQFSEKMQQDAAQHAADLAEQAVDVRANVAATDLETAAKISRERAEAKAKPKEETTAE